VSDVGSDGTTKVCRYKKETEDSGAGESKKDRARKFEAGDEQQLAAGEPEYRQFCRNCGHPGKLRRGTASKD